MIVVSGALSKQSYWFLLGLGLFTLLPQEDDVGGDSVHTAMPMVGRDLAPQYVLMNKVDGGTVRTSTPTQGPFGHKTKQAR